MTCFDDPRLCAGGFVFRVALLQNWLCFTNLCHLFFRFLSAEGYFGRIIISITTHVIIDQKNVQKNAKLPGLLKGFEEPCESRQVIPFEPMTILALPTMSFLSTNPKYLESLLLSLLSPMTKYLPSGTVTGPKFRMALSEGMLMTAWFNPSRSSVAKTDLSLSLSGRYFV